MQIGRHLTARAETSRVVATDSGLWHSKTVRLQHSGDSTLYGRSCHWWMISLLDPFGTFEHHWTLCGYSIKFHDQTALLPACIMERLPSVPAMPWNVSHGVSSIFGELQTGWNMLKPPEMVRDWSAWWITCQFGNTWAPYFPDFPSYSNSASHRKPCDAPLGMANLSAAQPGLCAPVPVTSSSAVAAERA